MYTASGVARLRAGYSFTEASALAQVARCEKPMLFIHGTADDFIPYEMMDTLYNAKPGDNKAELTAEGARATVRPCTRWGTATGIRCLILLRLIWRNASDSIGKSGTAKAVPLLCCLGRIRRTMQQGGVRMQYTVIEFFQSETEKERRRNLERLFTTAAADKRPKGRRHRCPRVRAGRRSTAA